MTNDGSQAAKLNSQSLVRHRGEDREVIARAVDVADTFAARTRGLLGRKQFNLGEPALWIKHCNSVHTFFMRFAIDVVFVDSKLQVVSVHRELKPWRVTAPRLRATSVFELPKGSLGENSVHVGDRLELIAGGTHA